jgi:hypothetical protein
MRYGTRHLSHVDFYAACIAATGTKQMLDQRAVARAYVEHSGSGFDHICDET